MGHNNRVFSVNGRGDEMLARTVALCFEQNSPSTTCDGWYQTKEDGLILMWTWSDPNDKTNSVKGGAFPNSLGPEGVMPMVRSWLSSDFAKTVDYDDWCIDTDHDGHNTEGWLVYCGDWGHVGAAGWRAICGIKHAYMWHGK